MTKDMTESSLHCTACGQAESDSDQANPGLCRSCAAAVFALNTMYNNGTNSADRWSMTLGAVRRIKSDPEAFRLIARFAPLLNADAAYLLFYERDSGNGITGRQLALEGGTQ
jgi:hypothetical protein